MDTKRIFIVEDDQSCEIILRRTIQSIDPEAAVECDASAEQALLNLELNSSSGKAYDLIITDIFLSGENTGLDLWEICNRRFPATPILVTSTLSANRFLDAIGRSLIAPAFLPKPFYIGECRQMIKGLLAY